MLGRETAIARTTTEHKSEIYINETNRPKQRNEKTEYVNNIGICIINYTTSSETYILYNIRRHSTTSGQRIFNLFYCITQSH